MIREAGGDMSFIDRARDEAERRDYADSDWSARSARLLFCEGAEWAVEQEPTAQEIEAVAKFLYDTYTALVPDAWEQEDEEERDLWRNDARKALMAAREARKA